MEVRVDGAEPVEVLDRVVVVVGDGSEVHVVLSVEGMEVVQVTRGPDGTAAKTRSTSWSYDLLVRGLT